jgi:RNA polymerase sigma factor (TIGR02999 family)
MAAGKPSSQMGELTDLFQAVGHRDETAMNRLLALMYAELQQLARRRLRKSQRITLLDTTELVHECYLRFLKLGQLTVTDRAHFLAYSARVMRSIIVDFVKQRRARRRGGGALHVTLDTNVIESQHASEEEILCINEALDDLSKSDARLVQVVEMRYFAGLSEEEIALSLGITDRTVRRDWQKARLLLSAALESQ